MRKIWVFAIGVLICLTAAGGLAAPADGDSNGDQNDQPMTRMMKTVDGYLYLPLSYFMKGVGYGDRKYYGQEDGKAWLNVIGTRVEFRVPGEEDDPPGREFFQLTINGKTIDINRAVALPGDGHDPYVLGAVLAKAVGYIQKGSGLTMASVRYESDPKALTPGDLMVRSRNGGDLAVGQSDFYQVFSAYGPPVDMSNREGTGSSREHVYYSNGLFLDLSLNDSSQKWIVNHANIRSSEYWPPRSVKVGDPVTEMFKFFGDGYNQIGNRYYYTILSNYWEQRGIVFTVEDKKIAEIDIYNRAIPKKSAQ